MLPVFGTLLLTLPLMWAPRTGEASTWSMSSVLIYVFTVWVGLILLALVFGMAVRRWAYHWIDAPYAPMDDREGH